MEGPRPPLENEFGDVVRFLDTNLRPAHQWSIAAEYPNALNESNRGNMRIIKDQDKVLAHALIRPMTIKTPAGLFKVAGLGSVVTSTEHRNLGLSTKTIDSCLDAGRALGCDFTVLWTDIPDFYRRMGFELGGQECAAVISKEIQVEGEADYKFLETNKIAADSVHRLYGQHTVSSLRTLDETRKYLDIPNARVYTAWDKNGALKAYAVEGKGADLAGHVHEWGGGVRALMALFAHIRKVQARPITIMIPGHSKNLLRSLREQNVFVREGFLGMIKILNPQQLFAKIQRHARAIGVSDLVLDFQDDTYCIGARDRVLQTKDESDVVKMLFGPLRASEVREFGPAASEVLEKVLPLDLWIWGWDSV